MKNIGFILFVLLVNSTFAQVKSDIPFIKHLINKGYYNEAIYLIENETINYNSRQKDSLNYFRGWAYYSIKNLEPSTTSFLKVNKESPFYWKSHFFAGYNQIYLGNYKTTRNIFEQMNIMDEPNLSLMNFELSGLEMLQGNWLEADERLKKVNKNIPSLNQQVIALGNISKEQEMHRSKSPLLAGVMSGIIPGSGKIYVGKTGSGIASFIGTVGFGMITWENYHKRGIKNAKTIIFGSIFVVNYVSNIYGSVISVKVSENEYKDALHNQILFQLHVPLRNFFE